jgi:hypothetical protein
VCVGKLLWWVDVPREHDFGAGGSCSVEQGCTALNSRATAGRVQASIGVSKPILHIDSYDRRPVRVERECHIPFLAASDKVVFAPDESEVESESGFKPVK